MLTILLRIGMTASAIFPKGQSALGSISVLFGDIASLLILAYLSGGFASAELDSLPRL
jgi:hypothetical protein